MWCCKTARWASINIIFCIFTACCARPGVVYYLSAYRKPWTEARDDCQHIGGTLAKITTAAENQRIVELRTRWGPLEPQWVGASDAAAEGTWVWEDGSPVDASVPPDYVIDDTLNQDYMEVQVGGLWVDSTGTAHLYFVCETVEASASAVAAADIRACWVGNGLMVPEPGTLIPHCVDRNVQYFTTGSRLLKLSWANAQAACQQAGGDLAQVLSDEEQMMITRFRLSYFSMGDSWIGATDGEVEQTWRWLGGEVVPWVAPMLQPQNDRSENCLVLRTDEHWVDRPCSPLYRFICERDMSLYRPYGDTCFWPSSQPLPWAQAYQACQAVGGTLAKVDNAEENRLIQDMLNDEWYWIGANDSQMTNRYRWTDQWPVTWIHWVNNQPNSLAHQCVASLYEWRDASCDTNFKYICEKSVNTSATFTHVSKVIEKDKVVFRCDAGYMHEDQTFEKSFTCSSSVNFTEFMESITNCIRVATLMEASLENYHDDDITRLFDLDNHTCVHLDLRWTYLPMATFRRTHPGGGNFTILVKVTEGNRATAVMTTTVFVTTNGVHLHEYYLEAEGFIKCERKEGLMFDCYCADSCSVFIRFRHKSMQFVGDIPYGVCEIYIS